jgi:alpha-galactosidase
MIDTAIEAVPGLRLLRAHPGTELVLATVEGRVVELAASSATGLPGVRIEVDLADAVGHWHAGLRDARTLPPDWVGPNVTSLVQSAPIGALYNAAGEVLLGWAASEAVAELSVSFGVSEEHKTFVVDVHPVRPLHNELMLLLDGTRSPLADGVRRLSAWLSTRCDGEVLTPPPVTRLPVYSTWYTFTQDIDTERVIAEAEHAIEIGCGAVFIDDGWQRHSDGRGYQGCGDWMPDQAKFPNLTATVGRLHDSGAAVALWVAPLLLGQLSDVYPELCDFAPHWQPPLNCYVLDPRRPEVRAFVVRTCLRLVSDYGVELLKIDFLDQAMAYRDSDADGACTDVGQAMATMLADVRRALADAGHADVAFEFRQPYVSPAIARYGEVLRANDCPADSHLNRSSTLDARLGSVGQVIHADPMIWGPAGGAEAVAQQLYAGWFAVPQISMRLGELDEVQRAALRGLLRLWRDHADTILDGTIHVQGAERGYDLVRALRADAVRAVIVRYADLVIDVDEQPTAEVLLVNATPSSRAVLRTIRPIAGGIVRDASAVGIDTITRRQPGLVEIAVPSYGSVHLRFDPE